MIARLLTTLILFLLGLYAFFTGALGGGHILNPSGIAFLVLAAAAWFGWDAFRAAFIAARDESNVPIIRLNVSILRGMWRTPKPRRNSDETA